MGFLQAIMEWDENFHFVCFYPPIVGILFIMSLVFITLGSF